MGQRKLSSDLWYLDKINFKAKAFERQQRRITAIHDRMGRTKDGASKTHVHTSNTPIHKATAT